MFSVVCKITKYIIFDLGRPAKVFPIITIQWSGPITEFCTRTLRNGKMDLLNKISVYNIPIYITFWLIALL